MIYFFSNHTATTASYTLSLHDALPICRDSHTLDADGSARLVHVPWQGHRGIRRDHHAGHAGGGQPRDHRPARSEEHTSELQSQSNLVCRLLLEKKKISSAPVTTDFYHA